MHTIALQPPGVGVQLLDPQPLFEEYDTVVYCDGGATKKEQRRDKSAAAIVVYNVRRRTCRAFCRNFGGHTNNVAEEVALLAGIRSVAGHTLVLGDSEIALRHAAGIYGVNPANTIACPIVKESQRLIATFPDGQVMFAHIDGHGTVKNLADEVATFCMESGIDVGGEIFECGVPDAAEIVAVPRLTPADYLAQVAPQPSGPVLVIDVGSVLAEHNAQVEHNVAPTDGPTSTEPEEGPHASSRLPPAPLDHIPIDEIQGACSDWDIGTTFSITWRYVGKPVVTSAGTVIGRIKKDKTLNVRYAAGAADGTDFVTTLPPPKKERIEVLKLVGVNVTRIRRAPKTTEARAASYRPTSADNDLDVIPVNSIRRSDEPGIVRSFRDIIRGYSKASQEDRTVIFHTFLSQTKTVLQKNCEHNKSRPPPPQDDGTNAKMEAELRTIKRAVNLARKGHIGKAARVLDTIVREMTLSDDQVAEKLRALHPDGPNPPPPPHTERTVTVGAAEIRATLRDRGAAPGPNALTDEILTLLVADPVCMSNLQAMLTDILNNDVDISVRTRLVRSRLVPLPKPNDGIRPIAIGDSLLKLAGAVALGRVREACLKYFADIQFGVFRAGGCEIIGHNVRYDIARGFNVVTIDMSNAFNVPSRVAMADALYALPEFSALFRLFDLEYGSPSELVFFRGGKLHSIIPSKSGTRQGSTLGGVFFCIGIHPILKEAKRRWPGINVYAYMDDITMTGLDPVELETAFQWVRARTNEVLKLLYNFDKCEWYGPAPCPAALKSAGVTEVFGCIKVVGTYIGDDGIVAKKLLEKFLKHMCLFDRLREAPCTLQSWLILKVCGLPRQNFVSRTHAPHVTDALCSVFDEAVLGIIRKWTDCPLTSQRSIDLLRLPTSGTNRGGLGVAATHSIRSAAYATSLDTSLRQFGRINPDVPPPMTQTSARDALAAGIVAELNKNHLTSRHLREMRARHSQWWLRPYWMVSAPSSFAAAVRFHLLEVTTTGAAVTSCAGCRKSSPDATDAMLHAIGCAARPGVNVTSRHNALRDYVCRLLRDTSLPFEREPRDFEKHSCRRCSLNITRQSMPDHAKNCGGKLDRHGPDLRIVWSGDDDGVAGEIFYDFTVIHVTAPSYNSSGMKAEALIADREREKQRYYREANLTDDQVLVVLPVRALGGLGAATIELLRRVAVVAERCPAEVLAEFSFLLQVFNGEVSRGAGRSRVGVGRARGRSS